MSKSRVWQSAATLLFAATVSLSLSVGCSKQGEGERCDKANAGDSDCEDGLVCSIMPKDRCCPANGATPSDSRCLVTGVSSGGASSTGGASSSGGSTNANGGAADAGATNAMAGQSSSAGSDGG